MPLRRLFLALSGLLLVAAAAAATPASAAPPPAHGGVHAPAAPPAKTPASPPSAPRPALTIPATVTTAAILPAILTTLPAMLTAPVVTAAAFVAAILLALSTLTRRHLLAPLQTLHTRLSRLGMAGIAADHPDTGQRSALPSVARLEEAVDALSASARRNSHLHAEIARISDRAVTENRQMIADLEAAAVVQRAQLPPACADFPSGRFFARFRPSRVVAGDTYDCLVLPDGRTRVFLIDVAGHGTPAALVSVASHLVLKQALLSAAPAEPLAAIIARINRNWTDNLPYFTLLAVEIDPATETATLVQCGHPALIRIAASGALSSHGNGGLPLGVLADADFATLTCPFRRGDRLLLVTDGVTETAAPDQEMFGPDRLNALLARNLHKPVQTLFDHLEHALFDWRGAELLDDDLTLLLLEAT